VIYLGIDPGLSGGVAFYDDVEKSIEVFDMPVLEFERNKKTKREVSAHMLNDLLVGRLIRRGVLERVGAMPGQGVTGMFSLGRSVGVVEGVLAARGVTIDIVTPQTWQKAMKARDGKDANRQRAMELFPNQSECFKRKKDDGRAEAALMAVYASTL
jgi:hypothetical protein